MSDHCNPSNNNPNPYMVAAATIGIAKIIHDVSGHQVGPITGYQCAKVGSEFMDNTMSLLREKKEGMQQYVIKPEDRTHLLSRHQDLQPEMYRLQAETRTYMGSMRNCGSGREFVRGAEGLHWDTKSSSDRQLTSYGLSQAEAEQHQSRDSGRSGNGSRRTRRGSQRDEGDEESNATEGSGSGSGSEHPWEDDRSSVYVSCRSRPSESSPNQSQHGSNESVHRPHRSQYYPPQGAQPQPSYSGYPQASSSSQYSPPYTASHGYPPTGRY